MTSSHLLVYRLAELMLKHEQHMLPVDLLFDDEQIGDFVKSIQIDSPYQQMLFEGVLTESVNDEKLFVSFTVEGYFHFVLGEVVSEISKNKKTAYLIDLLIGNNLNGINQAIENTLNKDIYAGKYKRLLWLIDHLDSKYLELCTMPLTNLFVLYPTEKALSILLKYKTVKDYVCLKKTIEKLEYNGNNELTNNICQLIVSSAKKEPQSQSEAKLLSKCLQFLYPEKTENSSLIIDRIVKFQYEQQNNLFSFEIVFDLIQMKYFLLGKEILTKLKSAKIKKENSNYYNLLGICYYGLGKYKNSLRCFSFYHDNSITTDDLSRLAESKYNLSTSYFALKNYDNALKYNIDALEIEEKNIGKYNSNYLITLFSLAIQYREINKYDEANEILLKVIDIACHTLKEHDSLFLDIYLMIGANSSDLNNPSESILYYSKAKKWAENLVELKRNPDYFLQEQYLKIANKKLNDCNLDEADNFITICIQTYESLPVDNDFIPPFMEKARILSQKEDHLNAIQFYKKAIEIPFYINEKYSSNPKFWIGIEHYEHGLNLQNQEKKDDAIHQFELSLKYLSEWPMKIRDKEWRDYVKSVIKYIKETLK